MTGWIRRHIAWLVAGASLTALALAAAVGLTTDPALHVQRLGSTDAGWWVAYVTFSVGGGLVATRRPENPVGWLMLTAGAVNALTQAAAQYGVWGLVRHPGSLPGASVAAWMTSFMWTPSIALLGAVVAYFPDGRLVSRRWRWLPWTMAIDTAVMVAITGIDMWPRRGARLLSSSQVYETHTFAGAVIGVIWPVVLVCVLGAMVSIVIRWRRAVGLERQQLKWLMLAVAVSGPMIVIPAFLPGHSVAYTVTQFANSPAWFAIAAALAVLRYRLYDIDRIVSRTVSYAVVTGLVVGLYVGGVALAVGVLRFSSSIAVAAATLVAAGVVQPLRRRVQGAVDRRFNRASYDARRVIEAFSARLRDQVDADAVHADLLSTVELVVAPTTASVWVPA